MLSCLICFLSLFCLWCNSWCSTLANWFHGNILLVCCWSQNIGTLPIFFVSSRIILVLTFADIFLQAKTTLTFVMIISWRALRNRCKVKNRSKIGQRKSFYPLKLWQFFYEITIDTEILFFNKSHLVTIGYQIKVG